MMNRRHHLALEPLESRLALSASAPASAIGTTMATVSRPHEVSRTSVQKSAGQPTLVGDVNGDGKVDLADLHAFVSSYMTRQGDPSYNPAADFNHNGVINQSDAGVLLHHMAPLTPNLPLTARLTLAPQDQIHYSGPTISGAATFQKVVTILGHTTPGSLVIEDNHTSRLPGGTQAYKFTGPAHATDANGFFSITSTNLEGLTNNNFLILDPFGHRMIIDFPIYWISFARGRGLPR
jgi:hypothetical protein